MARINSTTVSLTERELEKLVGLYRISFGSYANPDKTQIKLDKALGRIKAQQEQEQRLRTREALERADEEATR